MKITYLVLFLSITTQISCLSNGLQEQGANKITDPFIEVPYCELIKNPSVYDGKKVRIAATYRSGYEWSEMYNSNCFDLEKRTWVEFENLDEGSATSLERVRTEKVDGRTLSVIFTGKFEGSKGGYGHLNGYRYVLKVSHVDRAQFLFEGSKLPSNRR